MPQVLLETGTEPHLDVSDRMNILTVLTPRAHILSLVIKSVLHSVGKSLRAHVLSVSFSKTFQRPASVETSQRPVPYEGLPAFECRY